MGTHSNPQRTNYKGGLPQSPTNKQPKKEEMGLITNLKLNSKTITSLFGISYRLHSAVLRHWQNAIKEIPEVAARLVH